VNASGTPPAEVQIDADLVRALLAEQHPDLAALPLAAVGEGWDNAIYRLGDRLSVRLPRRAAAAALIEHEQTWLPRLAPRLTLPIPVPHRTGTPALDYPWRWSVLPWLNGSAADRNHPDAAEASAFGAFLRSLHVAAPADAPTNPFRGVPLTDRATATEERIERLRASTDLVTPAVTRLWSAALDAPIDTAPTWIHGDLHPRNVLVNGGTISAVIDWGDIASGDPATDLAAIWMLFDDVGARANALERYALCSAATLCRARGWAVFFGVVLLDTGLHGDPRNAALGERILRRIARGTSKDLGV
jgi:aminoglycoside phosphotransferase (APT) family kinase protein